MDFGGHTIQPILGVMETTSRAKVKIAGGHHTAGSAIHIIDTVIIWKSFLYFYSDFVDSKGRQRVIPRADFLQMAVKRLF